MFSFGYGVLSPVQLQLTRLTILCLQLFQAAPYHLQHNLYDLRDIKTGGKRTAPRPAKQFEFRPCLACRCKITLTMSSSAQTVTRLTSALRDSGRARHGRDREAGEGRQDRRLQKKRRKNYAKKQGHRQRFTESASRISPSAESGER